MYEQDTATALPDIIEDLVFIFHQVLSKVNHGDANAHK